MSFSIQDEWGYAPPESLVAGVGCYSAALAFTLGTVAIPFDRLHAGPESNSGGGFPRVLEDLKHAFLVVPEHMSATDVLRCHQSIWNWIEKLTSAGDQHELAFLFVLPNNVSKGYEEALAVGLSVPAIDPGATGHAIWRRSGGLLELLDLINATRPMDLLPLMARRTADSKRLALTRLRVAATHDDPTAIGDAVLAVCDAFYAGEYHLDLFCRPPSHRHGNLLRAWLNAGVTGPVTPDWYITGKNQLAAWLVEDDKRELP